MPRTTPGPWRVGERGHTVYGPPNGNPSPELVATIHGGTDAHTVVSRMYIMEANARLIAAAPEMLAALKYIVNWTPVFFFPYSGEGQEASDMAIKAIAKAEGKTHG